MRKSLMEIRSELENEITQLRAAIGDKAKSVPVAVIDRRKMSYCDINDALRKELGALQSLQRQIEATRPKPPPPVMTRETATKELERLTKADPKAAREFWQAHKKLLAS